jgi:hypothetical protein
MATRQPERSRPGCATYVSDESTTKSDHFPASPGDSLRTLPLKRASAPHHGTGVAVIPGVDVTFRPRWEARCDDDS